MMASYQRQNKMAVPLLAFCISFQIYLVTLSPTIAGGDSGELVAEGCQLGTAHPPGYPLYTVLVYVTKLFGEVVNRLTSRTTVTAYYTNVLSAALGAGSSAVIAYLASRMLEMMSPSLEEEGSSFKNKKKNNKKSQSTTAQDAVPLGKGSPLNSSAALAASVLYSLSPLVWQYHVTSEVFALNNFLSSLLLLASHNYIVSQTGHNLYAGAFLCGLAMCNQHTSILFQVPIIISMIIKGRLLKATNFPSLVNAGCFYVVGLSLYFILPLLATWYPHKGSWGDVTSLSGLLHHFRRADYGTFQLYSGESKGSEGMKERTQAYFRDFEDFQSGIPVPYFGWILFSIGVFATTFLSRTASAQVRHLSLTLSSSFFFYLVVFHTLSNLPLHNPLLFGVHQRFWMQPNIVVFIFIGVGGGLITDKVARLVINPNHKKAKGIKMSFAVLITVLLAGTSFRKNYALLDQSSNTYFDSYARGILSSLPPDSLLLINYDQQWTSIRYIQECEGYRPDVTSMNLSMMSFEWWKSKRDLYPAIKWPGTHYTKPNTVTWKEGGFTFKELADENYNNGSFGGGIFVGGKLNYQETDYLETYEALPWGFVNKLVRREDVKFSKWVKESRDIWKRMSEELFPRLPEQEKYDESTWEWTIRREFNDHLLDRASYMLEAAIDRVEEGRKLKYLLESAAIMELLAVTDEMSRTSTALAKNLGLAYMHMVRSREGNEGVSRKIWDNIDESVFYEGENIVDVIRGGEGWISEDLENEGGAWKSWATLRWSQSWETFLNHDEAKDDPSYEGIKRIFEQVYQATSNQG